MASEHEGPVTGYAEALLRVAEAEDVTERFADELFRVARTVEGDRALSDQLTNPGVGVAQRLTVVEQLLEGRAHPLTVSGVAFVVQSGRARQLGAIADEVARLAAEARSRALAEVRSAVELDDAQRERLVAALNEATGKDVDLRVTVDPSVVGGVVAKVGDIVIDGSVSRRLADLKTRLTG